MATYDHGDTSVLTTMFAHNVWANLKLLDFCEQLTDAQLDATAMGCFGTIRDTLWHIIGGEVSYVARVNGKLPPTPISRDRFPGFAAIKDVARWTNAELLKLALAARHDTMVREQEHGLVFVYPLASLMAQAINHASEHRAQIAAIITQLGLQPPDMDVWQYMLESGQSQEFEAGADEL